MRRSPGPLHHYRYLWIAKATGRRLIEAPKEILRGLQRRILDQLVARIPVHDAAHGFVAGRSVRTYASPHAGRALVLRMDLADFFPSITAARVAATFRRVGYAPGVAHLLARLVTNRTPDAVLEDAPPAVQDRLRRAHLPQGAPTSPALANLCAFRLDARLAGLARAFGATYTRYADDLAFSGDGGFRASAEKLRLVVCRIAAEEGFLVRWEKNRWMGASDRQQLAGLVVNERPRPSRAAFDALKATLHNCVVKGPASQDRDRAGDFRNHLLGKVAWFEHVDPARGARLRALFDRIPW